MAKERPYRYDGPSLPLDETEALKAADAYVEQVGRDFEAGYYPGLCSGASDGTCPHNPPHRLNK